MEKKAGSIAFLRLGSAIDRAALTAEWERMKKRTNRILKQ